MPLVPAKCPNCGGQLEVDNSKEAAVCPCCGQPYIVEKAVQNYKIYGSQVNLHSDSMVINVVNGSSLESLIKKGKEIIKRGRTIVDLEKGYENVFVGLDEVANQIKNIDHDNFYGHYFDYLSENGGNIASLINAYNYGKHDERKELYSFLINDLRSSITYHAETGSVDILTKNVFDAFSSVYFIGCFSFLTDNQYDKCGFENEINSLKEYTVKTYEEYLGNVANTFTIFYFDKDTVTSYDFQHVLCDYISKIDMLHNSIEIFNSEKSKTLYAQIANVIISNRTVIMSANSIYGEPAITHAMQLIGKNENSEEVNQAVSVTVSDVYIAGYPSTVKLSPSTVEVRMSNLPYARFNVKDILFMNMKQWVNPDTFNATLWYDIVFRINSTTYSLVHFGYDMKSTETFYDCKVFNSLSSWAIHNSIKQTSVKYESGNPFAKGYNGLTFVDLKIPENLPKQKSGGCYVATCVYGSYDCPEVWVLRRYRDFDLAKQWYGRLFIKVYYAISPTLVKWFGKTNWFKKMWKGKLDRMVAKYKSRGFKDTPYDDINW